MKHCQSCGGVIGVDCFNPVECAWISQQQENDGQLKTERHTMDLELRLQHLEARIEHLEAAQEHMSLPQSEIIHPKDLKD